MFAEVGGRRAGMGDVEPPAAIRLLFGAHKVDGVGNTLVGRDACGAQVVQSAQDVVVPPGWEGELSPVVSALAVALDRLASGKSFEEPSVEQVVLTANSRSNGLRRTAI